MGSETLKGWKFHQIPSDSFTSSGNHHQPGKYLIHLSLFSSHIFWSTLGCVLSTPFGVHFCLPVLLYNFYFSWVDILKYFWTIFIFISFHNHFKLLCHCVILKGGFKSEDTGVFLHLQYKFSKSLYFRSNFSYPYL